MSDTDRLIESMARDLAPVRRIPALRKALLGALSAGGSAGALWIGLHGVRADLFGPAWSFGATLAGIGLLSVGGLLAAMASSVPGRRAAGLLGLILAAAGLALCAGAWVARAAPSSHPWWYGALSCTGAATVLAIPSAAVAALWIARTAPREPRVSAGLTSAGSVALGASVIHATCALDDSLHTLLWHALAPLSGGSVLWLALCSLWRLLPRARA